jgi:hypothetical protein
LRAKKEDRTMLSVTHIREMQAQRRSLTEASTMTAGKKGFSLVEILLTASAAALTDSAS